MSQKCIGEELALYTYEETGTLDLTVINLQVRFLIGYSEHDMHFGVHHIFTSTTLLTHEPPQALLINSSLPSPVGGVPETSTGNS